MRFDSLNRLVHKRGQKKNQGTKKIPLDGSPLRTNRKRLLITGNKLRVAGGWEWGMG